MQVCVDLFFWKYGINTMLITGIYTSVEMPLAGCPKRAGISHASLNQEHPIPQGGEDVSRPPMIALNC